MPRLFLQQNIKNILMIFIFSLGDTPLCAAASAGQKTSCDVLLRRGADTCSRNLRETPPLHLATRYPINYING